MNRIDLQAPISHKSVAFENYSIGAEIYLRFLESLLSQLM